MNQQIKFALASAIDALNPPRNAEESAALNLCREALDHKDDHANFKGLINLALHPKTTKRELQIYAGECQRCLAGSSPLERLKHHVTGAIERGEAVAVVEKPLPWHVVNVSTNRGSFGHAGVIVLNENGEGLELTLQAYGVDPLPKVGAVLEVLPRSEIQPRKLPHCKAAKKIIASL